MVMVIMLVVCDIPHKWIKYDEKVLVEKLQVEWMNF